jgi:hypothetical protein
VIGEVVVLLLAENWRLSVHSLCCSLRDAYRGVPPDRVLADIEQSSDHRQGHGWVVLEM